jgi:hypothetical protein
MTVEGEGVEDWILKEKMARQGSSVLSRSISCTQISYNSISYMGIRRKILCAFSFRQYLSDTIAGLKEPAVVIDSDRKGGRG